MLGGGSVVFASRKGAQARLWLILVVSVAVVAAAGHGPFTAPPAGAAATASFTFSPPSPLTFEEVHFTSNSTTDLPPLTELWDLDDDGKFDDASGPTAARSFSH